MPEPVATSHGHGRYRFGVFEFDAATLELTKHARPVRLRPQSLKLLKLLVVRPGELVSRDEIQQALWGQDTFIDYEQGVNHGMKELRAVLGDTPESPRFIQTLPRRGYRFIAPIERIVPCEPVSVATLPVEPLVTATGSEPAQPAVQPRPDRPGRRVPIVIGLGVASLVGGLVVASSWLPRRGGEVIPASSLAVAPLSTLNVDPALGVGLADAISARLGGQRLIVVRPRGAAAARTSSGVTGAGGNDTAAGMLTLEGDVSRTGDVVAVQARLRDSVTDKTVWSERFQVKADDLFSIENVIADRVAAALNLHLAAAEQDRLRRHYTDNAAAYEDYLRGRADLVRYTPDGTRRAIAAFDAALQKDPSYALARAGLAMACADMCLRFAPAPEVEAWCVRAQAEARAALELDPNLAEAHLARAAVARKGEFDWNVVVAEGRQALALNPNLDQAHYFISGAFYHLGYMEEALIEVQRGKSLRGADAIEPIRLEGLIALFSGNFAPARAHLEEVRRLGSQALSDFYLAQAYYYSGNAARGEEMLTALTASESAASSARARAALAGILAARGQPAAARGHLDRVLAHSYRDHHVAYGVGVAYAQLGEVELAVRWLRTAADTGFLCLTWFQRDPLLDTFRQRPEFAQFVSYVRERRESMLSRANHLPGAAGQ